MAYLILLLLLGAGGMTRLLIAHRRKQTELQTVDGFRTSLAAISPNDEMRAVSVMSSLDSRRAAASAQRRRGGELDPERRAAAKRRIEERRSQRSDLRG